MDYKIIIIILLISMGVISCQKAAKNFLTNDFSHTENYTLTEVVDYPVDSIGHADFIFSNEDYIILVEPQLDYLISSYNVSTKAFKRFLKKGMGPDELLDVQQISLYKNGTTIFVKSTFGKDIFLYSIKDAIVLDKIQVPENSVSLYFDENQVISSKYGKKRFSIYDEKSKSHFEFGDSILLDNYSQELISRILQGFCFGNVKLKRLAWASFYGEIFEIYDYHDLDYVKTISSTQGVLPIVSIEQNQPVFSIDSKFGIVSIAATDKYIYMLYNENMLKDYAIKKQDVLLCNKILVYDWEGKPVKIINVDKLIRSISYNKKHSVIYCLGYDENSDSKIFYISIL